MTDAHRQVFKAAIDAMRCDLEALRERAVETEALIARLVAYAGIETTTTNVERDLADNPPKSGGKSATTGSAATTTTKEARPGDAKELAAIVVIVAEATQAIEKAKDAATLKAAAEELARAEREGGKIICRLGGHVRLKKLGIDKQAVRRWKRAGTLSAPAFESRLRRRNRKMVAALKPEKKPAATAKDVLPPAKTPPAPPAPDEAQPTGNGGKPNGRRGLMEPKYPATTLSAWEVDQSTGTMSRTLTGAGERQVLRGEDQAVDKDIFSRRVFK